LAVSFGASTSVLRLPPPALAARLRPFLPKLRDLSRRTLVRQVVVDQVLVIARLRTARAVVARLVPQSDADELRRQPVRLPSIGQAWHDPEGDDALGEVARGVGQCRSEEHTSEL